MIDPASIGAVAAETFAMAAGVVVETGVGEAVKDAYNALKSKIRAWAGADVEALEVEASEKRPTYDLRQAIVAEAINRQSPSDLSEVQTLALALNEALREAAKSRAIGIDIGVLEAARVHLQEINVAEGVGFRANKVKTPGDFTVGKIDVGKPKR